jgi:uncharacterized damage-inducible protein DinB
MTIAESMLPEFDQEMAGTRKMLERVPDDRLEWSPHAKSYTMLKLAQHVAHLPTWGTITFTSDSFVIDAPFQWPSASNRSEILALFDRASSEARSALARMSDDAMMMPWSLVAGGKTLFTLPKVAVFRGFVMNHLIHHRAQLSVYLRMNDVSVPGMYGPSADDTVG